MRVIAATLLIVAGVGLIALGTYLDRVEARESTCWTRAAMPVRPNGGTIILRRPSEEG
jgi:hypothetical protein